jgi:hypothetical protein
MASTLTVKDGILFCSPYIKQQRFNVNNMQPALGAAQVVVNTMLGAPFSWRQNRATFSIPISSGGGTDYSFSVPNLGHIETQWLTDGSGKIHALNGAVSLARTGTQRLPTEVAPQYDDNQGNITFRFNAVPDVAYTALFDYQQKPPLLTGFAQPWGLPDEFAHIFFTGLLAWAAILVNDARFPIWNQQFVGNLLGAQQGLDEQAKIIFMGQWESYVRTAMRMQQGGAQPAAKR